MADNLCGPSNGAKNLVNHVNRDRSLQQDRMVNGAQSSSQSSFRSQSANANAADQAFAGFLQNGPLLGTQIPMGGNIGSAGFVGDIRSATPAGVPGPSMIAAPHGFNIQHPQGPSWASPAPSTFAGHGQDWVNQFSSMQVSGDSSRMASSAVPRHQSPAPLFQAGNINTAAHLGFAPPAFIGGHQGMYAHGPSPMYAPNVAYGSQQQVVPIQNQESSIDVDAFNAAFGAYDDGEFSQELASWAEKQEGVEAVQEEASVENQPLLSAAPNHFVEEVVQNQEQVEAARRNREDEELARAAISILGSVSENDSEKFKNSNFFELMRRIGNREVVVEGTDLVDASTGETLIPKDEQDVFAGPRDDAATTQVSSV